MTNDCMIAQCVGFLSAGFETVELTLSCIAWDLAMNTEVQEKLIDDITKTAGELNYDTVQEIPFLDCVIKGKVINYN